MTVQSVQSVQSVTVCTNHSVAKSFERQFQLYCTTTNNVREQNKINPLTQIFPVFCKTEKVGKYKYNKKNSPQLTPSHLAILQTSPNLTSAFGS